MSDGSAPTHRGIAPDQVAEIIVTLDGEIRRRGSGYRVGLTTVLTAAHVIDGAVSVQLRFNADLPGQWMTEMISCWTDPRSDLAVLIIAPREGESPVAAARFGRISARAEKLTARVVGFPLFKLKNDDGSVVLDDGRPRYRDWCQLDGSVAVLSKRGWPMDTDRGHGRIERRTIQVLPASDTITFPHAAQAFLVERYVSDLPDNPTPAVAVLGLTSRPATRADPQQIATATACTTSATSPTTKTPPASAPAPAHESWHRYATCHCGDPPRRLHQHRRRPPLGQLQLQQPAHPARHHLTLPGPWDG